MPLPLPGSPNASWPLFMQRVRNVFAGADPRVCVAFWLFGLINNVLYVIILSAALDFVGPNVPKGAVLLADIIPSFTAKLIAPYFIHVIPYSVRILCLAAISATGMFMIALTPPNVNAGTIAIRMVGVVMASFSSGGGELSFVGLIHFYGPFSLAAWGSGTGGAGLIGAGYYALATTVWGLSVKTTILVSAFLPLVMIVSFFVILPHGPLKVGSHTILKNSTTHLGTRETDDLDHEESEGLLDSTDPTDHAKHHAQLSPSQIADNSFAHNFSRVKSLFFPYILPLVLVYLGEYTINQGVAPTLLFPLDESPFNQFRAFYPTYNAIYQCGVFISRSSTPFFRIHNLYVPSFLQLANLAILVLQSLFYYIPTVYIIFIIVFWEGLLGGLVYVNTFAEISDKVDPEDREFSLSATTVGDSIGIFIAGFISMALEVSLCRWQVKRGKDWCKRL